MAVVAELPLPHSSLGTAPVRNFPLYNKVLAVLKLEAGKIKSNISLCLSNSE